MPTTRSTPAAPLRVPSAAPDRRQILLIALGMMLAVHTAVRIYVVARGNFYWDDLILISRAGTTPVWSRSFLLDNHDGHVMPAAFAVVGAVTSIAPLSWPVAAATLVVGQVIASLAVARLVIVIAGLRPATLVVLGFYLVTPMTVPSFAWWASGLNNLPFQAALAWVVADAVLLTRDRTAVVSGPSDRAIAVRSAIVFAIGLAFFEKSALILPVAFAVAVLSVRLTQLEHDPGEPTRALPVVLARGRRLWIAVGAVAAVWAVLFVVVARPSAGEHSVGQTAALVWRAVTRAIVPSVAGGPWTWDRWVPSPPFGTPGMTVQAIGWVLVALAVVAAIGLRRGAASIVVCSMAYVLLAQALVSWNRSSSATALELSQTLRYLPDTAVVLTAAAAMVVAAPRRIPPLSVAAGHRKAMRTLGFVIVGFVTVGSVVSTVSFVDRWRDDPTGPYLAAATRSLADSESTPMFDQALPLEVLLPVAYPDNLVGHVFSSLRARPDFGDWTDDLHVLGPTGVTTPGAVTAARRFDGGSGACDRPEVAGPTTIGLDGPIIRWRWTAAFAYCANGGGSVQVRIGDSAPVTAPVRAGLHRLWVQASGTGTTVSIRPLTPGLALHLADGVVGQVYDPALLPGSR